MIHPDDEIHLGGGQRFRVLDVVPFDEEDESPLVGLLQVEAALASEVADSVPALDRTF